MTGVVVEIHPSSKGLATIFDKDVLIYCISKLMHRRNHGEAIGPVVRITTHDLLVSTNRNTGGIIYERLEDALDRLAGTRIKTNIETGDEKSTQNFGLIEWYDYNRKGSGFAERLRYLDIKLSDWLFRAIEAAEVLPISRDYFRLRRPLDRRVYEIARKHCGKQDKWRISIDKLQRRTGSKQERKHFAAHMRSMVQSNHLPDYALTLEDDQVVFWRRAGEGASANRPTRRPMPISRMAPAPSRCRAAYHGVIAGDRAALRDRARLGQALRSKTSISPGPRIRMPRATRMRRFLSWVRGYTKGKPAP